jgi:hypothetical protein
MAALGALTAAMLGWSIMESTALRARVGEAISGLDEPVRRSGPRLVVALDPTAGLTPDPADDGAGQPIPYYAPLLNLGALYAVAQGGIPPYVFTTSPRLHPFVFSPEGRARFPDLYDPADLREPKLATDPMFRRGFMTFLAAVGTSFEDVVVYGRAEDGDVLAERGYEPVFRRGGLFMGRFAGCPVTISVTAPSPRTAPVFVEYGFDPMPQALTRVAIREKADAGAEIQVKPEVPLCGPAWLRVTLDVDRSGGPSRGDKFCEGADAKGRVRLTAHKGETIRCAIAP